MSNNPENNNYDFLDEIRREIENIQSEHEIRVVDSESGRELTSRQPRFTPEKKPVKEPKKPAKPAPEEKINISVTVDSVPDRQPEPPKEEKRPEKKPAKPPKPPKGKKKSGWKLPVILFLTVAALLGAAFVFGAVAVSRIDTIFPNVCVEGTNLGGLSEADAAQQLRVMGWDVGEASELSVTLPAQVGFTVDMYRSGAKLTPEVALRKVPPKNERNTIKPKTVSALSTCSSGIRR